MMDYWIFVKKRCSLFGRMNLAWQVGMSLHRLHRLGRHYCYRPMVASVVVVVAEAAATGSRGPESRLAGPCSCGRWLRISASPFDLGFSDDQLTSEYLHEKVGRLLHVHECNFDFFCVCDYCHLRSIWSDSKCLVCALRELWILLLAVWVVLLHACWLN